MRNPVGFWGVPHPFLPKKVRPHPIVYYWSLIDV
jgi:hypothetical protein